MGYFVPVLFPVLIKRKPKPTKGSSDFYSLFVQLIFQFVFVRT